MIDLVNPRIIEVKSPEDILYPLERRFYEDPQVIYHGTSSVYVTTIEKDGWTSNVLPYDMHDIEVICPSLIPLHTA